VDIARRFLPSLRGALSSGRLQLTLVAGIRQSVADKFKAWLDELGLVDPAIEVLVEPTFEKYYERFNDTLSRTDILWTKPSEMTFFGALGLPMVLSHPVGVHERYNRRWAIENGAGLKMRDPRFAGEWLHELLTEGTFAAAAWHGFVRMPKFGTTRIAEMLRPKLEVVRAG
jgi:hypothetical protein